MKRYFGRVCIAFSIFVNALLGGKNNQTFSAGQYARQKKGLYNCVFLIDIVFFKRGHCNDSWVKWEIINASINHYDNMIIAVDKNKVEQQSYDLMYLRQYVSKMEQNDNKLYY